LLDASDQCARVSLVPEGAMLLAADRIDIDIEVGAGTRLEIIEPAGTVAYDMRGRHATWDVRIRLAAGSTLVWAGEPFVAAAGSDVRRTTTVELGAGARLALRETLVLGRYGEWPGRVKQSTRVSGADGSPLLAEDLDLDPVSAPHLIGRHRVVSSVLAIGGSATPPVPDDEPCLAEHRYDLESGGALWRRLGTDVHATQLTTPWAAVR
ncbi:MAG: urease accessory protein UreD, partial [Nocardioides sp.]